ncbi:phage integrase SAM-like domain-containing protein [Dysgonomonas sp. HDW5B]|uniref:phage integrase SAM-like domain-containing protein n=1 Tax=Dysgonomonas sp. HDW5B TaxID=2714927 RepID=UPI002106C7AE|nr:phage integrase SAM-like domain-containing protein [Dysgonomonas sp. HDW5B]
MKDFDINLTFTSLTEDRTSDYVNYLRIDKDMRNTTIGKQVNLLKWFLRWAVKKGYTENIVFEKFKPKLKTTQKNHIFNMEGVISPIRLLPDNLNLLVWLWVDRIIDFFIPIIFYYPLVKIDKKVLDFKDMQKRKMILTRLIIY